MSSGASNRRQSHRSPYDPPEDTETSAHVACVLLFEAAAPTIRQRILKHLTVTLSPPGTPPQPLRSARGY